MESLAQIEHPLCYLTFCFPSESRSDLQISSGEDKPFVIHCMVAKMLSLRNFILVVGEIAQCNLFTPTCGLKASPFNPKKELSDLYTVARYLDRLC